MRKTFLIVCALVIVLSSVLITNVYAAEAYKVDLSIDFYENLVFSRYDVDLYVNNSEQAVMSHGQDYSCSIYVPEGKNTFYFYKHGNKGVKGSFDLDVTDDIVVSCRISCYSSNVDVSKINIQASHNESNTTRSISTDSTPEEQEMPDESVFSSNQNIKYSDIDFSTFTDEELMLATVAIKEEQRARMTTKIILNSNEETIAKGKTFKLTGEIIDIPEGSTASKFTWSSSDTAVAKVAQGAITAIGPGSAVISCSATLSDGTELTNECVVTVIVPVSNITVTNKSLALGLKEPATIEVKVKPENATDPRVEFSSSDPSIAIVSADGVVTPVSTGKTTITVTTVDGSNVKATCAVNVTAKSELGIPRSSEDGTILTLNNIKTSKGNVLVKPESGNIFLVVDYTIENQTRSSLTVSYLNFEPFCNGYKLDVSNSIWVCDNYNYLEDLEPGRKIKGQVCIEAPADWKEIEVQYASSSFWSDDKVSLMLYK